jgi:hypothetical protein
VQIEGTVDGNVFYPIGQANLSIAGATSDEDWLPIPQGFQSVRARVIAFTSGSITMTLTANSNPYNPQIEEYRQSYETVLANVASGLTAFDEALFTPPANTIGKKVNAYIKEIEVIGKGVGVAAAAIRLQLQVESTAQTGGTLGAAAAVAAADNLMDAAASGKLQQYTVHPTGGGVVVAVVDEFTYNLGIIATAVSPVARLRLFGLGGSSAAKPLIIRPGQFLALNMPVALTNAATYTLRIKWQERSW